MSGGARWLRMPCKLCGEEGLASRSEPYDGRPYICEGCEMYERGYAAGLADAKSVTAERDTLRLRVAELEGVVRQLLCVSRDMGGRGGSRSC